MVLVVAKATTVVASLLQTTWFTGWVTCPVGFTVIVYVFGEPVQIEGPFVKVGVTTIVATRGADVEFVAVKFMFPVPLANNPIDVLLLVQFEL